MDDPSARYTALARHEERLRHEERSRREARAAAIRRAAAEACRPAAVRRPRPTDALVPPRPHSSENPQVPGPRPRALSLDDFAESAMAVVRPVPGQEVDLDLRLGPPPALDRPAVPPPAREALAAPAAPASPPPGDWRAALRPATVLDAASAGPWTAYGISTRTAAGPSRTEALALAPYGPGLLLALASGPAADDACAAVYRHALRTAPALREALRTRDAEAYRRLGEETARACATVLADAALRDGTPPAGYTLRLLHVPVDDPGAPCGLLVLGAGGSRGVGGGTAVLRPGGDWYETPATAARLLEGPHPGGALLLTTGRLPADPGTRARLASAWAPGPPPSGPVSLLGQPLGAGGESTAVVLWRR
ncbi:hypothetical protein [Streptomyces sp. NRRL F-5630]|uniref:hypothetical protein n=1 Tax=Streptomyces sp. NRRL F-5630 TaxID=1463864 RepID=UPI003D7464C1